jgi:hypothetical protein
VVENTQARADAGALSVEYEALRSAVLSGGAGGWRLGHGVLAARGTVAWIAAVGEAAPVSPPPAPDPAALAVSSLPVAGEIVAVLAQMTLAIAA